MQDRHLVAIALIVSAVGFAGLLFALVILDVPMSTIPDAQGADDGTMMRITASVERVQTRGGMTIITISQPTTIDVTADGDLDTSSLAKGECVVIQGKKGSYNDRPQISASKIVKCIPARD